MTTTLEKKGTIEITTTLTPGTNRQILATARGHQILLDVRKERGGDDSAPTPPEYMAMALGGCVMNLARIIAAEHGIDISNLKMTVSGGIDPSRFMGARKETRAGFSYLTVHLDLQAALSDQEKETFYTELQERCPLCDTIANPTPLDITLV